MSTSRTRGTKSMLAGEKLVGSSVESGISPRILELQRKIHDENYLDYAIDRIAVIMSRHIVESKNISGNNADFLTM